MASHIFHKLHTSRKNQGIFDHLSEQNILSGPVIQTKTFKDLKNRNLSVELTCNKCQTIGYPNTKESEVFTSLSYICPNCHSKNVNQDIIPTSDRKNGPVFKSYEKPIKVKEENPDPQ